MHTLILAKPLDPATGSRVDVRMESSNDPRATGYGGQVWAPAILRRPSFSWQGFDGVFEGLIEPGKAAWTVDRDALKLANANAENLSWSNAPVEIRGGELGDGVWPVIFKGRIRDGFDPSASTINVSAEVDRAPFQAVVTKEKYAGTGGLEGGPEMAGRTKPCAFGFCRNIDLGPFFIDQVDNVFQYHAYGPTRGVRALFEGAAQFGAAKQNVATLAALLALDLDGGEWATCNALGLVRLGAPPAGVLTADVDGDNMTGIGPTTAHIILRAAAIAGIDGGLFNMDSMNAFASSCHHAVNNFITEEVAFIDMAQAMALPCNAFAGVSFLGEFFVCTVAEPQPTPAVTLTEGGTTLPIVSEMEEVITEPPFREIRMTAETNYRPMTLSEIKSEFILVPKGEYDAGATYREGNFVTYDGEQWLYINESPSAGNEPPTGTSGNSFWGLMSGKTTWSNVVDDGLKPEDNATVGAPVGTPVAGRPAEDVIDDIDAIAVEVGGFLIDIDALEAAQADAQDDIQSLFAQYGDTVAAQQSAAAAAQSATDAQIAKGLSESASGQAIAASNNSRLALASQFPEKLNTGLISYSVIGGLPETVGNLVSSKPAWLSDNGSSFIVPGTEATTLFFVATLPVIGGVVYEGTVDIEQISGSSSSVWWYARVLDENHNSLADDNLGKVIEFTANGQRSIGKQRFSKDDLPGVNQITQPGAAFVRVGVLINRAPGTTTAKTSSSVKVRALFAKDVSARQGAEAAAAVSEGWAAEASDDAASAATSSGLSATYRNQSQGFRNEAEGFKSTASSQATISGQQAVIAAGHAAAAQTSSEISARLSTPLSNWGATFSEWEGFGLPDYWSAYNSPNYIRADGKVGRYAYQQSADVSVQPNTGLLATFNTDPGLVALGKPGWFVIEAEVELLTGNLAGSGLLVRGYNSSGGTAEDYIFSFYHNPSNISNGLPALGGVGFTRQRFSKLFYMGTSTIANFGLYLMTSWTSFGITTVDKTLKWNECGLRPAKPEEISSKMAITDIEADIVTQEGVIADLSGKTSSYFTKTLRAGGVAELSMFATQANGTPASAIELKAQAILLGDKRALEIVGNNVRVNGNLSATAGIALAGNGRIWPLAYQSQDFYARDGEAVSFGAPLGGLPRLEFSTLGLAPVNDGEAYNLYADNLTENGFTARLKINTPGVPGSDSVSNDYSSGTAPTRQVLIQGKPPSVDGNYTFVFSGGMNITNQQDAEPLPGGGGYYYFGGTGTVYVGIWVRKSGVWQKVSDTAITRTGTGGNNQTVSYVAFNAVQATRNLGTGVEAFGVNVTSTVNCSGSLSDLDTVSWTTPGTASGTRSATPNNQRVKIVVSPS